MDFNYKLKLRRNPTSGCQHLKKFNPIAEQLKIITVECRLG
jgi:hypothetical protein